MHIHLDPVGGIAGDMFAASILDLRPDLEAGLARALSDSGLARHVTVHTIACHDHALNGRQLKVTPAVAPAAHEHRSYREVCRILEEASLSPGVRARTMDIFERLAHAESRVHGTEPEAVEFHEVGGWDSVADVVCAAWLIEALAATWSCAALPQGRGRVHTAHGELPVPAPAVVLLLEDIPLYDDGRPGERITPTGAAILRHLKPEFDARPVPMRLAGTGLGFGTRRFEGMSNVLRALAYEPRVAEAAQQSPNPAAAAFGNPNLHPDEVAVCEFEVDDQTAEDLAVGLDAIRGLPGVYDVVQFPGLGKNGRMVVSVQLLCVPDTLESTLIACFEQTSTLGVRWRLSQRAILARESREATANGTSVGLKYARRPGGNLSAKAEMSDIARAGGGRETREQRRRAAEQVQEQPGQPDEPPITQ